MKQLSSKELSDISNILGSKWTPLIVAELLARPLRFSEIERAIPTINPRMLSKRLDDLRDNNIVTNCTNDPLYSDLCYTLTPKGEDLASVIHEMVKWSHKHPSSSSWNIS